MPTVAKAAAVEDLTGRIKRATAAISTDFAGIKGQELTDLRRRLREQRLEYKVVKNRLAAIAAGRAGVSEFPRLLEMASGIVFGYEDPAVAARFMEDYVRATRSQIKVRGAVVEGRYLAPAQLTALANLPPREVLVSRVLGQMKAPLARLVSVLNSPVGGLAIVLKKRAEQLQTAGSSPA